MDDKELETLKKDLKEALIDAEAIYRPGLSQVNCEKIVEALDKLIDYKIQVAIKK